MAAAVRLLNPPENFDFTKPLQWPEWKQKFTRYWIATRLNKEEGEVQVSTLIYTMGNQAEHIFKAFNFADEGHKTRFDKVIEKFDDHFIPKRNIIHERAKFHQRNQQPGESAEAFIRSLYELAEYCDFGEKKDEQIRDRIVIGTLDRELSRRLQLKSDLSLDTAIQMTRQSELIKSQVSDQNPNKTLEEIHRKTYANRRQRPIRREKEPSKSQGQQHSTCSRCDRKHGRDENCPAKGKQCRKCNKTGHFAAVCRSAKEYANEVTAPVKDQRFFMGAVASSERYEEPWRVDLTINQKVVNFKIDTGADITAITESTYNSLSKRPKLEPTGAQLSSPGGELDCKGQFTAQVMLREKAYSVKVFVIAGQHTNNLLGRDTACKMELIQRVGEVSFDVFGDIGLLKCAPVNIKLREGAQPYCVSTTRKIPFPLLPKVEEELERMKREGIIEEIKEPTDWCAPMVPVTKSNGKVRICVDLRRLNESVKRERYVLPTLEDIAPKLARAKLFTKLDASSGFWQIPLDDESAKLTTFITPQGRFCFRRLPFGITSAPEIFQRCMTELLKDQEGAEAIMDDMIIHGKSLEEHDRRLEETLKIIEESGLKLNKAKCEIRRKELTYFGHVINENGISPDPEKVRAIKALSAPQNVPELRQVLGMINYLGKFLPNLSTVLTPVNELLKADTAWRWDCEQQRAFDKVKEMLSRTPVLVFYDPSKPTTVSADASSYGIGGVLLQENDGQSRPVAFCSRTLSPAETRYSQIEKECLASVWACERFSRYLIGLESFKLLTYHKPLVPLINCKDLDKAPLRCQRLLMRLMRFNTKAEHIPGKEIVIADTLSRNPMKCLEVPDTEEDVKAYVDSVVETQIAERSLKEIEHATLDDPQLKAVLEYSQNGWPKYASEVPAEIREYYGVRNELSEANGKLVFGNRIVIPLSMREHVLERIHDGHQGITKCRERARLSVWWPGMSHDIARKVSSCEFCQANQPSQRKEPLITTPLPDRPWQKIAADLCELEGQKYLIVTDYYSRFIDIAHMPDTTSRQVIGKLKNMFARWGIPEEFISDNGPQFTSEEFHLFSTKYGFKCTTSSPHYPQGNGEAESGVRIAKRILKQEDPFLALMSYRATPIQATKVSPCQLMMGRQIRTTVPTLERNLEPNWPKQETVKRADEKTKVVYRKSFDRRHGARRLSPLRVGDYVKVKLDGEKGWKTEAQVVTRDTNARSYVVQTPKTTLRRNRRHLRPTPTKQRADSDETIPYELPDAKEPESPTPEDPSLNYQVIQDSPERRTTDDGELRTLSGRLVRKPQRYIEEY